MGKIESCVQTNSHLPSLSLHLIRSGSEVIMLNLCLPVYFHRARLQGAVDCVFLINNDSALHLYNLPSVDQRTPQNKV